MGKCGPDSGSGVNPTVFEKIQIFFKSLFCAPEPDIKFVPAKLMPNEGITFVSGLSGL
jgi:hypothetical protein